MQYFYFIFSFCFYYTWAQSLVHEVKYDLKELRCLVCQKSVVELDLEISKIDPDSTIDVGGHRLDVDGNYRHKSISQAKSELHLSELIDEVCNKMDNYVRALWKSNGTLTLFSMLSPEGIMNADFDSVDLIQDEDLNKSLKYYCEGIMEEHEEALIKMYQNDSPDIKTRFCFTETGICPATKKNEEL
ncbi:protein seele [Anoplophora glabripennis]|uniref:protein seele n=1 Tax=Anoplophora glabripennis TaxID=217634 RepID=UPI000873EAD8|nr:protein seele [Anoplophora glabripennis]